MYRGPRIAYFGNSNSQRFVVREGTTFEKVPEVSNSQVYAARSSRSKALYLCSAR